MGNYSHKSKSDLKELYIEKDLTQKEVGERCSVSISTISKWLDKFKINTGYDNYADHPTTLIKENYDSDKTFKEMAKGTKFSPREFRYKATSIGVHTPEKYTYTDEELLELLQKEYDETPSKRDIQDNNKLPSESTFQSHFGTWNNAVEHAGFKPNRDKYTTDEITQKIRDSQQSEPYNWSDIKEMDIGSSTIISYTTKDTIAGALEELGFEYKTREITDEELIAKMKECD